MGSHYQAEQKGESGDPEKLVDQGGVQVMTKKSFKASAVRRTEGQVGQKVEWEGGEAVTRLTDKYISIAYSLATAEGHWKINVGDP